MNQEGKIVKVAGVVYLELRFNVVLFGDFTKMFKVQKSVLKDKILALLQVLRLPGIFPIPLAFEKSLQNANLAMQNSQRNYL